MQPMYQSMAIAHSIIDKYTVFLYTPLLKTLSRYFSHTFPDPSLAAGASARPLLAASGRTL